MLLQHCTIFLSISSQFIFIFHFFKAAAFLSTIATVSAIIGFSKTLATAKKQEYKVLEKAGPNAAVVLEGGTALAMRALAWGSLFAVLGTGSICFGIWKLSGAKNVKTKIFVQELNKYLKILIFF